MAEEKFPYQSEGWVKKLVEMTNADEKFRKSAKAMNDVNVYVTTNCPDNTDRITMYGFKNGEIVDWGFESRSSPFANYQEIDFVKKAAFITIAPYDFMCKINRKEIGPFKALSSKEMKVQGSKAKMMRLIKPLQMWQEIIAGVPVEY